MKRIVLSIATVLILTSCSKSFDKESDFRNYLRDKHPYCHLIEADLHDNSNHTPEWSYQVNDTLRDDVWIYISGQNLKNLKKHLVK